MVANHLQDTRADDDDGPRGRVQDGAERVRAGRQLFQHFRRVTKILSTKTK